MGYAKALLIKYGVTTLALWLVLGAFYGVSFGTVLFVSFLITVVGFLLGDLFILPKFENWGATITDFLLVFAAVWLFSTYYAASPIPSVTAAAITAIIISVCEIFFHKYVDSHLLHVDNRTGGRERHELSPEEMFQTETGEEIDPIKEDDYFT